MYLNFMLIYMGEYTDEVLERCNIAEVTEEVLGFAEMACYFIGIGDDNPKDLEPWEAPDTWVNIAVASAGLLRLGVVQIQV